MEKLLKHTLKILKLLQSPAESTPKKKVNYFEYWSAIHLAIIIKIALCFPFRAFLFASLDRIPVLLLSTGFDAHSFTLSRQSI
jgi:hypothetical protein